MEDCLQLEVFIISQWRRFGFFILWKPISWADHSLITVHAVINKGKENFSLRNHYSDQEIHHWLRVSVVRFYPFTVLFQFLERSQLWRLRGSPECRVTSDSSREPMLDSLPHWMKQQVSEFRGVSRWGNRGRWQNWDSFQLRNFNFSRRQGFDL